VKCNLDQAKTILSALMKVLLQREEKQGDVMDNEVSLQRIQMEYKFIEDSLALPGFLYLSWKFGSGEDEIMDSDDLANKSNLVTIPPTSTKQEFRCRHVPHGSLHKLDFFEPVLLFTKPLVLEKLVAASIFPLLDSSRKN
ncbi:hypothetical protein CISIN_1g044244mg, partial [Citrus sinensis]